jgi:hypothetical protein
MFVCVKKRWRGSEGREGVRKGDKDREEEREKKCLEKR